MSIQATNTAVRASTVVDAPIDQAFSVFTDDIGSWWSPNHHILEGELAEMVFEPRQGACIYDRATDGSECRWARVLVYERPHRIVFSWDVSPKWKLETDPAKTSEVEVRFVAEDVDRTRVELEHRNLERHGEGWEGVRAAVASPGGWPEGLESFRARAAAA
jgi:uncharacterized protein YndB with AHSA1/START domain